LTEIPLIDLRFDIIVSNPPYISLTEYQSIQPEIHDFEPDFALTDEHDGLDYYRRFFKYLSQLLKQNGNFFIEIGLARWIISLIFSEKQVII